MTDPHLRLQSSRESINNLGEKRFIVTFDLLEKGSNVGEEEVGRAARAGPSNRYSFVFKKGLEGRIAIGQMNREFSDATIKGQKVSPLQFSHL